MTITWSLKLSLSEVTWSSWSLQISNSERELSIYSSSLSDESSARFLIDQMGIVPAESVSIFLFRRGTMNAFWVPPGRKLNCHVWLDVNTNHWVPTISPLIFETRYADNLFIAGMVSLHACDDELSRQSLSSASRRFDLWHTVCIQPI